MNSIIDDPGKDPRSEDALTTVEDSDEDGPASYRDLTKEEVLEGIARGYRDFLEGNCISAKEFYDEFGWHMSDDAT